MKNIFLINSPLQALNSWLIIKDKSLTNCVVFVEGQNCYFPALDNCEIIYLPTTFRLKWDVIKSNLSQIESYFSNPFNLFITDPFFAHNCVVISAAYRSKNLQFIYFVDEGMVIYWFTKVPWQRLVRGAGLYIISKIKTGNGVFPRRYPFETMRSIGGLYCLSPHLESIGWPNDVYPICTSAIGLYSKNIIPQHHELFVQAPPGKKRILFLAQPHHYFIPKDSFAEIIKRFSDWLSSEGYNDVWLKPHHQQNPEDVKACYSGLKYHLCFSEIQMPAECLAPFLTGVDVVSNSSSALINMKAFGFHGRVISQGYEDVAQHYTYSRSHLDRQKVLFVKAGVEVI